MFGPHETTENERTEPEIATHDAGTRVVFTETEGSVDCWLSAASDACIPEGEWR